MIIWQAAASDEPHIRECAEKAYARYIPLIGRKPAPMTADYRSQIAAGNVFIAVDEENDAFKGFITFYPEANYILLENVAVLPEAAGQGVGKALIGFCENMARERGFTAIRLYTNEKMTENLFIYPRLGYVENERRTEDGFNRVYFEKII